MSLEELMAVAERGITLIRLFNLREGFSAADDRLPERFASPPLKGNLKEKQEVIDPIELREAQKVYYQMLGWDEEGRPKPERLAQLGLEWASKYLDS
jgi:aldehyde:ferredoxin oxidoreductase